MFESKLLYGVLRQLGAWVVVTPDLKGFRRPDSSDVSLGRCALTALFWVLSKQVLSSTHPLDPDEETPPVAHPSPNSTEEVLVSEQNEKLVVITGAGGFIGGHLVSAFRARGYKAIRAVDIKPLTDLYQRENCEIAARGAHEIYNLAANMGGMGFIENNKALCMLSVLINTQMLQAAQARGVSKFFYSSSACVYNADMQRDVNNPGLREEDAY